jgi:hypothetical protein
VFFGVLCLVLSIVVIILLVNLCCPKESTNSTCPAEKNQTQQVYESDCMHYHGFVY